MAFYGINDANVRPDAVAIDGDEERRGLAAAGFQQIRRTEIKMHRMAERVAVEPDIERAAHHAVRAVAADEIIGLDSLASATVEIDDLRGHAAFGFLERFEPRSVAQAHMRKGAREALQDRVEPHLRAHLQPHRAVAFRLLAHARRARHAAELVAREARHEGDVERIVRRKRTSMDGVGDAPAPAELHGADVHLVHLGRDDGAVALLDQRAGECRASRARPLARARLAHRRRSKLGFPHLRLALN